MKNITSPTINPTFVVCDDMFDEIASDMFDEIARDEGTNCEHPPGFTC